jgi:hypothetical protein
MKMCKFMATFVEQVAFPSVEKQRDAKSDGTTTQRAN